VRMTRAVVPHMKARGGGGILSITAISAIQPIPGFGLSVATWGGVIGFAKTLSLEVARDNINVNTICPGYIETQRLEKVFAAGGQDASIMRGKLEADGPHRQGRRHRRPRRASGLATRALHHGHGHPG